MRGHGQTRQMNSWERQFYLQLSHTAPEDGDFPVLDACLTVEGEADRRVALEAAFRQALVDTERAHSD
jgi:hypothetical protein